MAAPRIRLGDLLVEAQLISPRQLEEVLARQREDRRRLGTLLVEAGLVSETQVTQILSQQLAVPWVSLYHIDFSRQLLNLVPSSVVEQHCLVPIFVRRVRGLGQTLYVAMDDPTDEPALEQVRQHSGLPVRAMIAPPSDIRAAIRVYYGASTEPQAEVTATEPRPAPPPKPPQAPDPGRATAPSELDIEIELEAPRPDAGRPEAGALGTQRVDAAEARAQPETEPPPAPDDVAPAAAPSDTPMHDAAETTEPPAVSHGGSQPGSQPEPAAGLHETGEQPADSDSADQVESSRETSPELEPGRPHATPGAHAAVTFAADAAPAVATESAPPRSFTPVPESSRVPARDVVMPQPRSGKGPRMVSLTLLDGTTINLPARSTTSDAPEPPRAHRVEPTRPASDTGDKADEEQLTARDLVAALRAVSHGADATEILGENAKWESMFAALLSLLLKKHLIADWEFIEEYKRV